MGVVTAYGEEPATYRRRTPRARPSAAPRNRASVSGPLTERETECTQHVQIMKIIPEEHATLLCAVPPHLSIFFLNVI